MKDFKLAMIQISHLQENSTMQNIDKMENWIQRAAGEGAHLVMFGELGVSGYLLDSSALTEPGTGACMHYRRAEAVPGPSVQRLEEIAKKYGVYIAAGMGDLQAGVVYNAYMLIGPDGYIGKQRKLHIPLAEAPYYGAGSEFNVFDIGYCKIGLSICFDNWFPETSRILTLKGAEVILSPWMWIVPPNATDEEKMICVRERRDSFLRIFGARALDNAAYVMVLDHVGLEAEEFEFPGLSMAYDPFGRIIAETEPFKEQMLLIDIQASAVEKYRTYGHHYTLKFRRPDIYGELSEIIRNDS
ncbi:MAG: hypothetical protein GXY22_00275 [Clostridiaceae bacterium]|jgi:predicted amidohydrolase|nr:hypothetical protein [Eubacteriales bacterium]NLV47079.1 hypothetical protein [Clostridiaceae bacterium]